MALPLKVPRQHLADLSTAAGQHDAKRARAWGGYRVHGFSLRRGAALAPVARQEYSLVLAYDHPDPGLMNSVFAHFSRAFKPLIPPELPVYK
jgi:hypothetical protein